MFDQFGAGEYGLLGETLAPAASFTGANVVKLVDGSLAPRSGLKDLAPSGVAAAVPSGFGYNAPAAKIWFTSGSHAYQFSSTGTGNAVTDLGSLGGTPTQRINSAAQYDTATYVAVYGVGTVKLDHSTPAATVLTSAPAGRHCAIYGRRLVVASTSANGNRLWYSATNDFVTWPAANFVDVGKGFDICALVSDDQRLLVGKTDGSWWQLHGALGGNYEWREIVRNKRPAAVFNAARRWGTDVAGTLWYLDEELVSPITFQNGFKAYDYLSLNGYGESSLDTSSLVAPVGVGALRDPADVLFTTGRTNDADYDDQGLLWSNGMWSRHEFGVAVSGMCDGRDDPASRAFICDGGTTPKFYSWSYDLNRPAISGNADEALYDGAADSIDCGFTLPVFYAKDGSELAVSSVVVNFTKWGHAFDADNTFTVTVTPKQAYGAGDLAVESHAWSEDEASASTAGESDQHTTTFAARFANGFTVGVTGMVGVAIRRLVVTFDERPMQGTA